MGAVDGEEAPVVGAGKQAGERRGEDEPARRWQRAQGVAGESPGQQAHAQRREQGAEEHSLVTEDEQGQSREAGEEPDRHDRVAVEWTDRGALEVGSGLEGAECHCCDEHGDEADRGGGLGANESVQGEVDGRGERCADDQADGGRECDVESVGCDVQCPVAR